MLAYQPLIAEYGNPGDRVHVLRVQKAYELRQVVNGCVMTAQQSMLERNIHAAVAILNIEDNRIAADLTPTPNDPQSTIASRHQTGQVYCADLKITRDGSGLLHDGCIQNSGNHDLRRSAFDLRMASDNSVEVRYEVWDR